MLRSSVDGRITRGRERDASLWASKEDAQLLFDQLSSNNLIVMGSGTYDAAKSHIKLTSEKLRVVLTRNPEKYQSEAKPGMLEFSNEEPRDLIERLEKSGYKNMLLFGGARTAGRFLKDIDEVLFTIEPVIFGRGTPIITGELLNIPLKLVEFRRLNPRGTLFLRYEVIKNAV